MKIGTEVAHVTRDSDTIFKGQGHQAAFLNAVLARQAAAAVDVRTCWPWETAATSPSAGRYKKGASAPTREERDGGMPWRPPAYSLFLLLLFTFFILLFCCVMVHFISFIYSCKTQLTQRN